MGSEVTFRIILQKPPAGVDYGMQKGKGSNYETIQKQRSVGKDLYFELTAGIKDGKNSTVDFHGPFVQGPAGERFVYIDIGTCAGQANTEWSRRLKIPLAGITPAMIKKSLGNAALIFEATVPGKGRDGGPNCATVKPFDGWKQVLSVP